MNQIATDCIKKAKEIYELIKGRHINFPEIPMDIKERIVVTTQVSIYPQSLPYADCVGNGMDTSTCKNILR